MNIKLAISGSGHDKGSIYVVIKEEEDGYYLADGSRKTAEKPKWKNRKHVQIIKRLPGEISEIFMQHKMMSKQTGTPERSDEIYLRNDDIKRAVKLYHRHLSKSNESSKQALDQEEIRNVKSRCN